MLAILNDANAEWIRTFKRGSGEPPVFMKKETGFDLIADTTLSAAQAASASTTSLTDSSDFAASGAIAVWDDNTSDIEEYTSNAANVLSGVTGADFAHESGDTVQALYALPSNFGTFRSTEDAPDGVITDSGIPLYFTSGEPRNYRYAIYDNGTTKYIQPPKGLTSGALRVYYNKKSTVLDETTDTVDVPSDYQFFLVYRLVEHGRRVRGENADKVQESRMMANELLLQAQKEKNVGKMFRTRPIGRMKNPEASIYRTNFR